MKRFDYPFKLTGGGKACREYGCGDISARLDFLEANMVRMAVYKSGAALLPSFSVCPEGTMPVCGRERLSAEGFSCVSPIGEEREDEARFVLPCGITLSLTLQNLLLRAENDRGAVFVERAPMAQNFGGELGEGVYHFLTRERDERVFGLGDKGGSINKAGRAFRIDSVDCMGFDAERTDPLYKHIPFYICENSAGSFGIFYDTSANSYIDLGAEVDNYYGDYKYFKTEDNALVFYLMFGTRLEILKSFARLCGKPAFPPKWSFGYCASTMAYTDAPDAGAQMEGFLKKLEEERFECSGFYLSSGYTSIGDKRYVFNWSEEKFPDPKAFAQSYESRGIHLIPNIKPAFLTDHPMYNELAQKGFFIHYANGEPALVRFWDGFGSLLDFTNPAAFAFWKEQVTEKLLKNGISCTWNDNNEFGIRERAALCHGFGNGEVPACQIRPVLTYLMGEASRQAQEEFDGAKRPFLSTRSGNAGSRRIAQTWSGDNRSEFSDLRFCHNIGMTLSLSGQYFYGHDLGGFSGEKPGRELLLRWLQHGVFEPRFTIHSWNSDGSATMPWTYPDIEDSVRALFAQRKRLAPYLYDAAYRAVAEDAPMNAPAFMLFDDSDCPVESDSFMVGSKLLAACIFDEGKTETAVYLPKNEGGWFFGGERYEGGKTVEIAVKPTDESAFFVRCGSIICTDEAKYAKNAQEQLVFSVFAPKTGSFEDSFFTDDGEGRGYLEGECVQLHFQVTADEKAVSVIWQNHGKMPFTPEIRLCPRDERVLICERKEEKK